MVIMYIHTDKSNIAIAMKSVLYIESRRWFNSIELITWHVGSAIVSH